MAANAERAMLPLHSLLNPSSTDIPARHSPAAKVSSPATEGSLSRRGKIVDDASMLAKSKARGPVNYPPFEDLDEKSLAEVVKFQVTPFGQIHRSFEHIPYSSSKKDLFEKTGRESIEAFKYDFRVPAHDRVFAVMWDYNIGIVRMNPFIKWGGFPKSSQMLDKNPGLRDISPGPTGGSVLAQGYWVPYNCARALCATFCYPIAGALIPLFGPSFPADCIPPESSGYNEMIISRPLLAAATREAELSRGYYMSKALAARHGVAPNPRLDYRPPHQYAHHGFIGRHPGCRLPADATQNALQHYGPDHASMSMGSRLDDGEASSQPVSRFKPATGLVRSDDLFDQSSPYLTAVPQPRDKRSDTKARDDGTWTAKRRRLDPDKARLGHESATLGASKPELEQAEKGTRARGPRQLEHYHAAMVLATMKKDTDRQAVVPEASTDLESVPCPVERAARSKRPRAKSL